MCLMRINWEESGLFANTNLYQQSQFHYMSIFELLTLIAKNLLRIAVNDSDFKYVTISKWIAFEVGKINNATQILS